MEIFLTKETKLEGGIKFKFADLVKLLPIDSRGGPEEDILYEIHHPARASLGGLISPGGYIRFYQTSIRRVTDTLPKASAHD